MKRKHSAIVPLTAGLLLIGFLLWRSESSMIAQAARQAMSPHIITIAALLIVTTCLGAFNAYLLIGWKKGIGFSSFLAIYWQTWAWGLVIPGQLGDVISGSILMQRFALAKSTTMGRFGLDKAVSFFVTLAVGFGGLTYVFGRNYWQWNMETGALMLLLAFTATLLGKQLLWRTTFKQGGVAYRLQQAAINATREFTGVLAQAPHRVLLNALLTVLKIMLTGLVYWLMLRTLGETGLSYIAITSIAIVSGLIAYLPLTVNGLGTVEIIAIALFAAAGSRMDPAVILVAYLVIRLTVLILAWLPTAFFMLRHRDSTV